ncbi:MAG: Zn-ribbon domain-containing OB-fold protein [Acidobacteriia bacterium]|nr:Zn-ribbon domain-containing OB-fold protein [Terriglobia bacterium]
MAEKKETAKRTRKAPSSQLGHKPQWNKLRLPETDQGTVVFSTDPLIIKNHYEIDYIHSYAEDSPFFIGLSQGRLMGSECTGCRYKYATPRAYCMECGKKTKWIELPLEGKVHTWTTCYFGSEAFLKETPFNLVLVEFPGINTLLLARMIGVTQEELRVGMKIRAQFRRNSRFDPTDVYFVPAEPVTKREGTV